MLVSIPVYSAKVSNAADFDAFQHEAAVRLGGLRLANAKEQFEKLAKYLSDLAVRVDQGETVDASFSVSVDDADFGVFKKLEYVNKVLTAHDIAEITKEDIYGILRVKTSPVEDETKATDDRSRWSATQWLENYQHVPSIRTSLSLSGIVDRVRRYITRDGNDSMRAAMEEYKKLSGQEGAQEPIDFFRPQIEEALAQLRSESLSAIQHVPAVHKKEIVKILNDRYSQALRSSEMDSELKALLMRRGIYVGQKAEDIDEEDSERNSKKDIESLRAEEARPLTSELEDENLYSEEDS